MNIPWVTAKQKATLTMCYKMNALELLFSWPCPVALGKIPKHATIGNSMSSLGMFYCSIASNDCPCSRMFICFYR